MSTLINYIIITIFGVMITITSPIFLVFIIISKYSRWIMTEMRSLHNDIKEL